MEYEERIDSKQGNYIVASSRDFENILLKETLIVKGLNIKPGEFTTLYEWFDIECQFVGFLEHDGNFKRAIFYLGHGDDDLFNEGAQYYDLTYIIDENQIGKTYRQYSFRNSFLHEKNGKYYWK